MTIDLVGMSDGNGFPCGVDKYKYRKPIEAAKSDCIVFRNTGNLNFSGVPKSV